MGIKRGQWNPESINKAAAIKTGRYGAKPAPIHVQGVSNSEHHMSNRSVGSTTPAEAVKGISDHRKEEIIRGSERSDDSNPNLSAPVVVYSQSYKSSQEVKSKYGLNKTADIFSNTGGGTGSRLAPGSRDTVRQAPEVYSPLFQIANLQLPRDRITMNAWNRNYYDTHPLVHNCINLHATYPINKLNIKCKDPDVERFFQEMCEEIDLMGILQNIALEFWKMGEAFPYAELDPDKGTWKNIYIQNPDYIHVKTSVLGGDPVISMRPDAALSRLVQSNAPADVQLRKQISEEIIHHVKKGNDIPLDNFHVSHLKMLSSPYDTRGTSVIVSVYKDIMLYDKLRESKFAQADSLVNPITLIKVGGNSEGEYRATPEVLEQWRQTFEAAQYDKDFKIISHAGVSVERIGASGAIIDISNDMNFIMDNILYGLMVPKAVLTQEGASFSSATVGLEVLKTRYEAFRNMMKQWLVRKVFAPISEIQGFYEYDDGDKKLIVPEVDWNQMILYDMNDYISSVQTLATDPQNPKVSMDTLYRSLGLNPDQEKRKIRQESIESVIRRKEQESLNQMSLATLRSLSSDSEIIEPTTEPLPGTPGAEDAGMPGMGGAADPFGMGSGDMGLGGGGGDLGGLGPGGDLGGGDFGGGGTPPPPPAGGEI